MSPSVSVHLLPVLFSPEDLRGGIAVVIDVLRASTTITAALFAGAESVIPCGDIEEAKRAAANLPAGSSLLGGERGGVKIPDFDVGNSPREYTPEQTGGRTIVFTTTNGTRALKRCEQAERIVIGSFANLKAVVESIGQSSQPVHLVCAGTDGAVSADDVLCAGAMVAGLEPFFGPEVLKENDAGRIAFEFFAGPSQSDEALLEALRESRGGRNLLDLGYDADIEWAAKRNRFDLVPEFDPKTGRITVAASGT